jgi:serine palmitoyltransferase
MAKLPPPSPSSTTSSLFRKKSSNFAPMASAADYLSAVSQADAARLRKRGATPTSTPALSFSSSLTEDSLADDDYDILAQPNTAPTSEQVFNTVHAEFGHCANDQFRYTSQHMKGTPVVAHEEQDPPYYILLSTYISYLILICLGHMRDFFGKRLHPSAYAHLMPHAVSLCWNDPELN